MNEKKPAKILRFDSLPSTNDYAKTLLKNGENTVVLAARQTGGRGTKGRSFSSEKGGVYLSALTFYDGFPTKNAFLIMARSAVAVCKTVERYGVKPLIKWPNDIYVNDKKICGILIENAFTGQTVRSSIVGIGLNVSNRLPSELLPIATTLEQETGARVQVDEVVELLIKNLQEDFVFDEYRDRVGYLEKDCKLIFEKEEISARPLRVEEDGSLLVQTAEGERRVFAAEVSLRVEKERTE